jgi:prepilin-type N-terminal cleavage/methylation domain-containing protein
MLKNLKKRTEGFTIIEVLIVLAIAGLILLVVFLAVPALQRNGRNTTKRSDVSKALGAVGEFSSNNGGKQPTTAADITSIQGAANLSSGVTLVPGIPPSTVAGITTVPTADQILIATGVTCNQAAPHVTSAAPVAADYQAEVNAGTTRSVVALYTVEASGGNRTTQCQGS